MCITAQTPTIDRETIALRHGLRREHMLLIILVFIALTAIVISSRVRIPGRSNESKLGWMSEKWLAEYARRT
jgi:hypothetical protein